jgi:hypothetical protein
VQRAEQFAKKSKKPDELSKGAETNSLTDFQHPQYLSDAELKGLGQETEIISGKPKKIADVRTQMLITAALNSVNLQKND